MMGEHSPEERRQHETGNGLEDSDFGDDLLRELVQAPLGLRIPRVGEQGGPDRRFKLLAELGGGAMGRVFRAWDEELRRVVALKFLLCQEPLGEEPRSALLREARAIAQLAHEHIVRLFDVAEWGGSPWEPCTPFLVMECIHGESLASLLRRGRPEPIRALSIMLDLTAGLAHAHAQGVIHRDLKPSNVLLTQQGSAKLLDFGLSYLNTGGVAAPSRSSVGTPAYMAPEQWRGESQDERTDLWAAGVLLYEMLAGALPYRCASMKELKARVASSTPVPGIRGLRPELPQEVEHLLATALAKDPSRRFSSALEFGERLRELGERLEPSRQRPRPTLPERRQVTLVSCQLARLARPSGAWEDEDLDELKESFHQCCADILYQYGGSLMMCLGDEVLACFGHPVVREADTERAVRVGLQLSQQLPFLLQRKLPSLPLRSLAVKTGVHTDTVALGALSLQRSEGGPPIQGEALKIASWLAEQAAPGRVLVSENTWARVRGAFDAESLGPASFEGLSETLRLELHHVLAERPSAIRFDRVLATGRLTPLVGREQELAWLLKRWQDARQGQGGVVLISGEAGIGKSRLIQELRERALREPRTRFQCQCWVQSSTSAFHPIIEMLRRLISASSRQLEATELGPGIPDLSPEHSYSIAHLLSPLDAEKLPHAPLAPERRKELTQEALILLLQQLAHEKPVLGVIEDVHWSDPSTLELLGLLLSHAANHRFLIVLSARPDFQPPWPEHPALHRLVLERLPLPQTSELVRQVAQGRVLPEQTLRWLVEKTDGVPLFTEELTRTVLEQTAAGVETIASGSPCIPATLHELLMSRLDLLPEPLKELARLCAAVGRSFPLSLPTYLLMRGEAAVHRDLEALVNIGLLQHWGNTTEPGYQFRHALFQDAAWQSLPRSVRRQQHRRIAQVLEEQFRHVVERQPELLAHHHTEAGETELAIQAWIQAGQHAARSAANEESFRHFQQALKLLKELPDTPQRAQRELDLLILVCFLLVYMRGLGSPEQAPYDLRILELSRQLESSQSEMKLSWYVALFNGHTGQSAYPQAIALAEQLLAQGQRKHDVEMIVHAHCMIAQGLTFQGDLATAQVHVQRSLENSEFDIARHKSMVENHWWHNPRVLALAMGACILTAQDREAEALRLGQEALELTRAIGHAPSTVLTLLLLSMANQLRQDAEATLRLTEEVLTFSSVRSFQPWRVRGSIARAWAQAQRGQDAESIRLAKESIVSCERMGLRMMYRYYLGLLGEILLKQGLPREALETLTQALERHDLAHERFYEAELYRLRGEALRALGQESEARGCFLRALHVAQAQGAHAFERRARERLDSLGP